VRLLHVLEVLATDCKGIGLLCRNESSWPNKRAICRSGLAHLRPKTILSPSIPQQDLPNTQQTLNLGVFYEDNASKKRRVLRADKQEDFWTALRNRGHAPSEPNWKNNFRVPRHPSRTDAKRQDHFLQAGSERKRIHDA
jgi:hypothetical protein